MTERRCVCNLGLENSTGTCLDKCRLEPFAEKDGVGGCKCQTGRVRVNGLCETCEVALKFGVIDSYGMSCGCQTGYSKDIFGFCIKCD